MAVKLIRGLSLYGSIDQVWQTAVPGFYIIGNCISYYIKKASGRMRTRANKNYAVSGHAQCENAVNDGMISAKCI